MQLANTKLAHAMRGHRRRGREQQREQREHHRDHQVEDERVDEVAQRRGREAPGPREQLQRMVLEAGQRRAGGGRRGRPSCGGGSEGMPCMARRRDAGDATRRRAGTRREGSERGASGEGRRPAEAGPTGPPCGSCLRRTFPGTFRRRRANIRRRRHGRARAPPDPCPDRAHRRDGRRARRPARLRRRRRRSTRSTAATRESSTASRCCGPVRRRSRPTSRRTSSCTC